MATVVSAALYQLIGVAIVNKQAHRLCISGRVAKAYIFREMERQTSKVHNNIQPAIFMLPPIAVDSDELCHTTSASAVTSSRKEFFGSLYGLNELQLYEVFVLVCGLLGEPH